MYIIIAAGGLAKATFILRRTKSLFLLPFPFVFHIWLVRPFQQFLLPFSTDVRQRFLYFRFPNMDLHVFLVQLHIHDFVSFRLPHHMHIHVHKINNKQRTAKMISVAVFCVTSGCLANCISAIFGEQVEKRFWFALSDLILRSCRWCFSSNVLFLGTRKKTLLSFEHRAVAASVQPRRLGRLARRSLLNYKARYETSVQGSIHQGSETLFQAIERKVECAFMALSALFHNESVPVHSWTKSVVNQILHHGNGMFSHTLSNNLVPDSNTLHFTHLPMVEILLMVLNLREVLGR